jgi:hypothetical protein
VRFAGHYIPSDIITGGGTRAAVATFPCLGARNGDDPVSQDEDRSNDMRLMTPLLVMGLIVVCGLLYFGYLGHA